MSGQVLIPQNINPDGSVISGSGSNQAVNILLDTSQFDNNFDSNTTNLQILADLVDEFITGSATSGSNVTLVTTDFDKNLDSSVDNVQKLADAMDELVLGSTILNPDNQAVDSVNPDVYYAGYQDLKIVRITWTFDNGTAVSVREEADASVDYSDKWINRETLTYS